MTPSRSGAASGDPPPDSRDTGAPRGRGESGTLCPAACYILQNVRGAPLREARRKVIDDRLERLCGERLTLDDLASIAVPDQKGEKVHAALMHLVDVCVKRLRDLFGVEVFPQPLPFQPDLLREPDEFVVRGRPTFEAERLHHATQISSRELLGLKLGGLERTASGIRTRHARPQIVVRPDGHLCQLDRLASPVQCAAFVHVVLLHPFPEALELPAHLVRHLEVLPVYLLQSLKDRLQAPRPPAPRIREMNDLNRSLERRRFPPRLASTVGTLRLFGGRNVGANARTNRPSAIAA